MSAEGGKRKKEVKITMENYLCLGCLCYFDVYNSGGAKTMV
jgi:hypothetical protein